jgi:hypothetical protein
MARPPALADAGPSAPDRNAMSRAQLEPSNRGLETVSLPDLSDQVSAQLLRPSDSRYGEFQRSVPICERKSGTGGLGADATGLALVLSADLKNVRKKTRVLGFGKHWVEHQWRLRFAAVAHGGLSFASLDSAASRAYTDSRRYRDTCQAGSRGLAPMATAVCGGSSPGAFVRVP